jgi:allantoin racemase
MRILVLNGNTTQAITDRAAAVAQATAGSAAEIVGMSAPFGPAVVTVAAENAIAHRAILEALRANWRGFDAIVLAISFDTALAEARALLPIPVYGITEEALKASSIISRRVGVITIGASSAPLYAEVLARYPESRNIVGQRMIDLTSVASYIAAESIDDRIVSEANGLAAEAGAEVVVICGAALAGAGARLQPRASCRLVDGVPAAVEAAKRYFGV